MAESVASLFGRQDVTGCVAGPERSVPIDASGTAVGHGGLVHTRVARVQVTPPMAGRQIVTQSPRSSLRRAFGLSVVVGDVFERGRCLTSRRCPRKDVAHCD